MTVHINPAIRALEDAEEAAGLIAVQKSDGFIDQRYQEDLGNIVRPTMYKTWIFNNTSTTK